MARLASIWALREIRRKIAEMSEEAKKTATVAEVHLSDDELLGGLFKLNVLGAINGKTYSELYDTTDTEGRFNTPEDRLAAAQMLRLFGRKK